MKRNVTEHSKLSAQFVAKTIIHGKQLENIHELDTKLSGQIKNC